MFRNRLRFILFCYLFFSLLTAYSQKRIIDKDACDRWSSLKDVNGKSCLLSNNGKYVVYVYGSKKNGNTTILKEIHGSYALEFQEQKDMKFSFDSRYFVTLSFDDRMMIAHTGKRQKYFIIDIDNFALISNSKINLLLYSTKGADSMFYIRDLDRSVVDSFKHITAFWSSSDGSSVVLQQHGYLNWYDLNAHSLKKIPKSTGAADIIYSNNNRSIAFIGKDGAENVISYFTAAKEKTYTSDQPGLTEYNAFNAAGPLTISQDGSKIFFYIKRNSTQQKNSGVEKVITKKVNIWSYSDKIIQEKQKFQKTEILGRMYLGVLNLKNDSIYQLENDSFHVLPSSIGNDFVLLTSRVNHDDFYWNNDNYVLKIFNLANGSINRLLETPYPGIYDPPTLSNNEKFVIWFDCKTKNYYSYEISTAITRCVTCNVNVPLSLSEKGEADKIGERSYPYGICAQLKDEGRILIYDHFDIWKIDLKGEKPPLNITNGYGRKNRIRLRMIDNGRTPLYYNNESYLLSLFDEENKYNGFAVVKTNESSDPRILTMGPYAYFFYPTSLVTWSGDTDPTGFRPLKAEDAQIFVVRRMSSTDAPNLFATNDFKKLMPISNLKPQKEYNWMTSEIVTWRLPSGFISQGVLFKPENFDSTRRYPVIFNYYERRSEGLNVFRTPELSSDNISIPWYVNREYLVFEPDLYYETGKVAQSIKKNIDAAVKKLSGYSCIDTNRMGIQGHSFGGYETCVMATMTNHFAAACEMAGPTNIVSEYGSLRPGGTSGQISADIGQRNIGMPLWDSPEVFIDNSPVFHIKNMTTPLLMVHNPKDASIPFSQAVELFQGLRRLDKKVWLLEYDGEGHCIYDEDNKLDYTIRMQQFFDHYLKGLPPAKWMTRGVSATLKGIESGLDIE